MRHRGLAGVIPISMQPRHDRGVHRESAHGSLWAKWRLLAALLAVVGGVACGGGGTATVTPPPAQPVAEVASTSLSFASQPVGTASPNKPVTLSNTGNALLIISAIVTSADFSETNTCNGSVAAGSSCTINVTFTPQASGTINGALTITDNSNGVTGSTQTVSLIGAGSGPVASFSAQGLTFANQSLNTTSPAQTETVTNTGNANLSISTAVLGGANPSDFAKSADTCTGATVEPNGSCTVSVTFTPSVSGNLVATLVFTDNNNALAGSEQTVVMYGTGAGPAANLSSPGFTFANQLLSTTSAAQTETISNTGTANLNISTAAISGTNARDFAKSTDTCTGATVVPQGTCTVSVTFTPLATGSLSASLIFTDNSNLVAGSTQTVSLGGTGAVPVASLSSPGFTFTSQLLNTTSAAQTETITNTGTASLSISTAAISGTDAGDFAKSADTCTGSNVAPQGTCTVSVTFTPKAAGSLSASLIFTDNNNAVTGSTQTVGLSGTGTGPVASLSSPGLTFTSQLLNTTSAAQTETVTNTGTANLSISKVALSGANASDFGKSADTCTGATLQPKGTCTVSVTFTPSAAGSLSASLIFTDNNNAVAGSTQTVPLSGSGTTVTLGLSAPSLSFLNEPVSLTSASQTETVTNTGTANLNISTATISGTNSSDFAKSTDTCTGANLAPKDTCKVSVTFTPATTGNLSASLIFTDNSGGVTKSTQTVSLTGTGTSPVAGLSSTGFTFTGQFLNTTSSAQTETITNTGTANLSISTAAISGTNAGDFAKSADTCTGANLAPKGTCTVSVTFTPQSTGSLAASLIFTDNNNEVAGSTQTVSLNGTGTAPMVGLSSSGLTFAGQLTSTTSTAQTVTLTNTGTANLSISTAAISGTDASDFARSADTCTGATVDPTATCKVSVTFTPSAGGSLSASLIFTDNSNGVAGSTQTVSLSGTGVVPTPAISFSVSSMNFANQNINTVSAFQTVTVTNSGTADLDLTTAGLGGTDPSDFGIPSSDCATRTLSPNQSCSVTVTFKPPAVGSYSATLNFTDNAAGSPQMVNLSGTGVVPTVSLSTTSVNFNSQPTGMTSAAQPVVLTNTGMGTLSISTAAISGANAGNFAMSTDTCSGATLTYNGTCTINLTLTPSATGSLSATLTFTDNNNAVKNSTQPVSLSGTGTTPLVGFNPSAGLSFGSQSLSTASTAQTETVTNLGASNLTISTVTMGGTNAGDFTKGTDACTGATLSPSGTCTVGVTFTPSALGVRAATLALNSSGNPAQTANLVGLGEGPLAGVYTQRYDNARTGQNTQETYLTPSNVTVGRFGKLFALPVDGQVYAQPLYVENVAIPNQGVHNVVYVATQHDSVFAFDADGLSAIPLWQTSFLNAATGVTSVPAAAAYPGSSADIKPEVGITSTPVIDPVAGTLYVTVKTQELQVPGCTSDCAYNYFYRLHALDITTGAEKANSPVAMAASMAGTGYDNVSGVITFNPLRELQRPGLLLLNGTLYIAFGSHGDIDNYHGWLFAYNATTLAQLAFFNTTPNAPVGGGDGVVAGGRGAIWGGGGGVSADSNGYLYVVVANGTFDANLGGVDYGDSVLKMQLSAGQFTVLDYFTPADQAVLDFQDLDLGSSPALILPTLSGTSLNLLATGGKDGRIWLLNRDNLGKYTPNDSGAVQVISDGSDSLFGGLSYWNGNLYVQEVGDYLKQYTLENGTAPSPTTSADEYGGFPDAVPTISSNGTSNGVLWMVETDAYSNNGPAVLHAFQATDVSNEIYNSTQAANNQDQAGVAVKFVVPTVANGKVYVGTSTEVDVYGPLP